MKTYTNFILLLLIFSCENHEQELQSYQQKIAELGTTHSALENKVKEQAIKISTLEGVTSSWDSTALQKANTALKSQAKQLQSEIALNASKGMMEPRMFNLFVDCCMLPENLTDSFKLLLSDTYRISPAVNPFYVKGQFNEDSVEDYAIFIEHNENEKQGLAIFIGGDTEKYYILGAGNEDNFGQDNMYGTIALSVINRENVLMKEGEVAPVIKSPQVIYVSFSNFTSAIAYLEEGTFKFYGQAD
ncbi:hypothetical protein [Flammeovirga sp. OC4]|uniref:hypothetical protein n=1 Tax=Flammeovirga sp. OC4 TaxID=1382345 RepID=UPI0005C73A04|nr:hypothetical protein [Flammeovirga sp. OC4]